MPDTIEIVDYKPEYAQAWHDLNLQWISEIYVVEDEDRAVLTDPQKYILDPGGAIPPNVTFKPTTISELNRRCSDLLGTRIDIQRRKLCDLKITYGVIFADDLGSFDFWSCSDLDIVWGNIRHFATDARLQACDIFSSRKDKLSGHCTLYRNTPEINRLFERIPNVRGLFATSHYEHLDERELTKYVRSERIYWDEELATNGAYQKALGDGNAWRKLAELNPGIDPTQIPAGTVLKLPK